MASQKNSIDSTPRPQYQTETVTPFPDYSANTTATIPNLEEIIEPAKPEIEPDLNAEKARKLEEALNKLSKSYYDYYAKVASDRSNPQSSSLFTPEDASRSTTPQSAQYAAQHLTNWLLEAKGDFTPYLKGAFGETLKNAFGPIGQAWRLLETAEYKLDPRSIHPLLDPYAIDRAARALENQIFKVVKLPFSTAYGLLAQMGMPGLKVLYSSTIIYNEHTQTIESQPITSIVLSPFYKLYQGTETVANAIDRWTGAPTNALLEHPYEAMFIESLDEAYKSWREAKNNKNKDLTDNSVTYINRLIDSHEGREQGKVSKNIARGLTRKPLIKLAKNLRRTDRDPFSYLGAILGGILFDFTAGLATNALAFGISSLARVIPGLNVARAYVTNFIHNSPWTTSSKIFGTNVKNLARGTLSLNTAASGYLGYQLGSLIAPNAFVNVFGVPINIGGGLIAPVVGGLGAFYQTGLLNATQGVPLTDLYRGSVMTMPGVGAVPIQVQWYNQQVYGNTPVFRRLFGFGPKTQLVYSPTDVGGKSIQTNIRYYQNPTMQKVFGATSWNSPISRFSAWLYRNPYARLPLKGLALSNILLNVLPSDVLSIQIAGIPLGTIIKALPFIDYAWQVKGTFFADVANLIADSRLGRWYGKNIYSPIQKRLLFTMYNPHIETHQGTGWLRQTGFFKTFYPKDFNLQARPWLQIARNTINPGFFLGFMFVGPAIASGMNPIVAAVAMPLAGSAVWTGYSFLMSRLSKTPMTFGKANALGYLGSLIGALTIPWGAALGVPSYVWVAAWTFGLPLPFAIVPQLSGWFAGIGSSIVWFAESAALLAGHALGISAATMMGGLTALGIAASIVAIVGAVLFTGFILFTVFSSFYLPFTEEGATNISSAFKINQTSPKTISVNQAINSCVDFSIIQNPLLLKEFYFYFTARYNNDVWDLTSGYNDKYQGYGVARQLPTSWQPTDRVLPAPGWHNLQNQINFYPGPLGYPQTNDRFQVLLQPVMLSDLTNANINIGVFGLDNPDQTHQRGKTLFELKDEFSTINQLFTSYVKLLQSTQTETAKQWFIDSLQVEIDVKNYHIDQIKFYKNQLIQIQNNLDSVNAALSGLIMNIDNKTIPLDIARKLEDANNQLNQCGTDIDCQKHFKQLINTYNGWDDLFPEFKAKFVSLQSLSGNQLSTELAQVISRLEQVIADYENQVKGIEATIKEVQGLTPTDLSNLTPEQINDLLKKNFDVFGKEFYYLPGNTQYKVCIKSTFNPDPAKYDLSTPESIAKAYADAAIPIEVAGNQEYIWGLSQPTGIATIILQFTPPAP